jgi:N4-gp56 family major capsid protein
MAVEVIADFSAADMIQYNKKGLDVLRNELHIHNWALPYTMDRHGGKNVRAYRIGTLSPATTPLTEGTAPSDTPITSSTFSAVLAQYGAVNTFSDMLEAVGPSSFMEQQAQIFGIQAGETIEQLDINEIVASAPAFYAGGNTAATFSVNSTFSSTDLRRLNKMFGAKKVRGMMDDKKYRAMLHPDVIFDVTTDDLFGGVTDIQRRDADKIKYDDAIGAYANTGVYRSALLTTATVGDQSVTAYQNIACGYGAFAAYDLKGMPLKLMLVPPDDINVANPLGLKGTVGWKVAYAVDYVGSDGPRAYVVNAVASEPTA